MHTAPQRTLEVSPILLLIINILQIYSHANTNKTYQWKFAHEIDKRPFGNELPYSKSEVHIQPPFGIHTKVKDRGAPGILRSVQMEVFDQTKGGRINQT